MRILAILCKNLVLVVKNFNSFGGNMPEQETLALANRIFQAIFGQDCPYSLAGLKQHFAADIQLPIAVKDSTTGEETFSAMPNAKSYITDANSGKRSESTGWLLPKRPIKGMKDLLQAWQEINYITTERVYDSEHVSASDPIYNSQNVYNSTNCGGCKNIIFCDGTYDSESAIACQRSTGINFSLRVDDSNTCSNSYHVICSAKISNSLFIQDASDLHECIFCSHLNNQKYCIANMQFEEAEYFRLKAKIIQWILTQK